MDGFHTITLGCKLNQFDTAAIEAELTRRGLRPVSDPSLASVVVVNTCTVTGKADAEARKLIRQVRRANPTCRLLVTGCYAELEPEAIEIIPGVDLVFGNREKPNLAGILDDLGVPDRGIAPPSPLASEPPAPHPPEKRGAGEAARGVAGDRGCDWPLALPGSVRFGDRSRAFLKVQEGCDLACSYCVIPRVRGPSRSVPPHVAVEALQGLLRAGYREIVLTGVNTGDWGKDLSPRSRLSDLLERLLESCGPNRIRLNSLEPLTLTDTIVDLLAREPRLAPHLQIPLQSGSEIVLRRMRRNYRLADYRERLENLRARVPRAGLGADVIVGFPGETDEMFEETYRFIESSPLNYLHVFSWSPRPGTPAADFTDRVNGAVIRDRSSRLRDLAAAKSHEFRTGMTGRRLDAVVLGERSEDGRLRALTGNFIEVLLEAGAASRGDLVAVRVTGASPDETTAVLDGRPDWAPTGLRRPPDPDAATPLLDHP